MARSYPCGAEFYADGTFQGRYPNFDAEPLLDMSASVQSPSQSATWLAYSIDGDRCFLTSDDKDGPNFMALITHGNGIAHVRRLCRHQPGPTQHSHGYPVFSPDDKWVLFNSRI